MKGYKKMWGTNDLGHKSSAKIEDLCKSREEIEENEKNYKIDSSSVN